MTYDPAEFGRLWRQLEEERAAAKPIVRGISRLPSAYLAEEIRREWMTVGFVEELSNAARELVARGPAKCAALAELATRIAAVLDVAAYPSILRAQTAARAWKELANAYRYGSRCEAALAALNRADAALAGESAAAHDRAVLDLARATTLRDVGRAAEALTLLAEAVEVFRAHGTTERVAQCELLKGMICHAEGNSIGARMAFRRAAGAARRAGDARTVASAYSNLARLQAEEGHLGAAMDGLQQARAIFMELGAAAEVARTTWAVGYALVHAGKHREAVGMLLEARRSFRQLEMTEEAGLVGVQLAETYLALNAPVSAAEILAAVIAEFEAAGLSDRAVAALAALQELGAAATPGYVRHVYAYLERLRREPLLPFELPPGEQ